MLPVFLRFLCSIVKELEAQHNVFTWHDHVEYIKVFNIQAGKRNHKVESKREEVKSHKNKILSINCLALILVSISFKELLLSKRRRLIYAKPGIIRLNTLHNFHPKFENFINVFTFLSMVGKKVLPVRDTISHNIFRKQVSCSTSHQKNFISVDGVKKSTANAQMFAIRFHNQALTPYAKKGNWTIKVEQF